MARCVFEAAIAQADFSTCCQVPADIKATVTFVNTKQGFTEFNTVACEGQTVIVDGTAKALLPKQPRAQLDGESGAAATTMQQCTSRVGMEHSDKTTA